MSEQNRADFDYTKQVKGLQHFMAQNSILTEVKICQYLLTDPSFNVFFVSTQNTRF